MTQQDIVNRLNQLTLRYNLTWQDVKYDADKAIAKINNYLGTTYPKMTEILVSPEHSYTLRDKGVDVEIFPDIYIHSVVIPYIATEVLARDEEFTTVYNKYLMEMEDGLFNMFQTEFHIVPDVFRQRHDVGVFFPSYTKHGKRQLKQAPKTFKASFRVHYHVNNENILFSSMPPDDYNLYDYGDKATLLDVFDKPFISIDGVTMYTFSGWAYNKDVNPSTIMEANAEITIKSDVHLYAVWEKSYTLNITSNGVITIKEGYIDVLTNLEIPDVLHGVYVTVIPEEFTDGASNLKRIVLPKYLRTIQESAFSGYTGREIIFKKRILTQNDTGISIGANAFSGTVNMTEVFLPYAVSAIATNAFPARDTTAPIMTIRCELLEVNKPDTWKAAWHATQDKYIIEWGYNG